MCDPASGLPSGYKFMQSTKIKFPRGGQEMAWWVVGLISIGLLCVCAACLMECGASGE